MSPRNKLIRRRASRKPPASGRKPVVPLSERDLAACLDELRAYHGEFRTLFQRREQQIWSLLYLCGQLSNLDRKTIEAMVLTLIGPEPNLIRAVQHFMGQGQWEADPLVKHVQTLVAKWLGEPDGVVIVDGSGFPKQGTASVGTAHQYCGHVGKVTNCQEGVFLVYASRQGYAFLDERLYMPAAWFGAEYRKRRQRCDVPATLTFHTEPDLGLEMLRELHQRAEVPFQWITCDESYGKIPAFLDDLATTLGKWYLAEVPADTRVWWRTPALEPPGPGLFGRPRLHPRVPRTAPGPQELRALVTQLASTHWHRWTIKEGSKGPLVAEFAFVRVTPVREQLPGPRSWAIFRRTLQPHAEVKFYLSNAPSSCPRQELVRISGMRWPVETALEEGKGEIGLDHYQMRTWRGWHHHMAHSFLAHLFLIRVRLLFQKKSRVDHGASSSIDSPCHRKRTWTVARSLAGASVSPTPEPRRLPFTPQAYACSAC